MENLPKDMSKIWEALQPSQIPLFQFPAMDIDHLLPWEEVDTEPRIAPIPSSTLTDMVNTIDTAALTTFDLATKLNDISVKMANIHQDIESEDHRFDPDDYDNIICLIDQIDTLITSLENKI